MIHLYAFARGVGALDDDTVELRAFGDVVAVVGDGEPEPLRHGLVVEALLDAAAAVLPVRYGERFEDDRALAAALAPRLGAIGRRLEHVAGCVEIAVRLRPAATAPMAGDGASYLRRRLREEAAVEQLHEALGARARDSVRTSRETGYLVARADVAAFSQAAAELLASHPELDGVCTGPWAPYTFGAAT